uniref:ORF56 n=1 Tax=Saccharolobus islandicus TaxID=43080 RepID=Q9C4X5_SACIS|nr:ORF56 [Sulfolobus islandicus]
MWRPSTALYSSLPVQYGTVRYPGFMLLLFFCLIYKGFISLSCYLLYKHPSLLHNYL